MESLIWPLPPLASCGRGRAGPGGGPPRGGPQNDGTGNPPDTRRSLLLRKVLSTPPENATTAPEMLDRMLFRRPYLASAVTAASHDTLTISVTPHHPYLGLFDRLLALARFLSASQIRAAPPVALDGSPPRLPPTPLSPALPRSTRKAWATSRAATVEAAGPMSPAVSQVRSSPGAGDRGTKQQKHGPRPGSTVKLIPTLPAHAPCIQGMPCAAATAPGSIWWQSFSS